MNHISETALLPSWMKAIVGVVFTCAAIIIFVSCLVFLALLFFGGQIFGAF